MHSSKPGGWHCRMCVNSIKEEMSSILPAGSSLGGWGMQGIKEGGVVHFHFWPRFPVNISLKESQFVLALSLFGKE